jgi:isopropylmalate/homocitrate/citramalate synthase
MEDVFVSRRRIQIFDTTLRDGEQSPGIALRPHDKAEIAGQLERLRVDVVEAGFAAASPGDFEGVRALAEAVSAPTVASLARSRKADLDAAGEALAKATRSRVQAGASQVECTVNGLGERAGNASLEEIVVALSVRGDYFADVETAIETTQIAATSRLVSERTGYVVQRNKAVVGANAFAHEAGIHQDGMLKDPRTYQIIEPASVGVRMTLPLGKHSGRRAFAKACAERGVQLAKHELDAAFRRFKELADAGGVVAVEDLLPEGAS